MLELEKNPSLFLSLPDDLVLNCLARISKSYYPELSLVCKTFRTLILSTKLYVARFHLKIRETFFNVCLQFPNNRHPSLFALWIKPGQLLTNQLKKKKKKNKTTVTCMNTRLVQIPSSYYSFAPVFAVKVGSEFYSLEPYEDPSSMMWVCNKEIRILRKAPNMIVARAKALAGVLNGKIYVMGGCAESEIWGESFDPKTQTWEPLPDPGAELRFSSIRTIEVIQGKLYVRSNENKDSVYDPKEGKWDVAPSLIRCVIENVSYCCYKHKCWWYDTKRQEWRVVGGLGRLNRNLPSSIIEIVNYGGKLLILWEKCVNPGPGSCEDKDIWCAMISVERRDDSNEVWGIIEWANVVLTVPSSCVFEHSLINIH